jgi:hypothetical protein
MSHHDFAAGEWPFGDPDEMGVFATAQVMDGAAVLLAAHDEDDGSWQFLHSADLSEQDADAAIKYVCFGCVYERHRELATLADLPLGWEATRAESGAPWQRAKSPPPKNE